MGSDRLCFVESSRLGVSQLRLSQPLPILNPDTEPDAGDGVNGIAEDHLTVCVEIQPPLGLFHELLHGLRVLEGIGDEVVGEQIRVLRDGAHEVPCVVVLASPTVDIFPCGHIVLNIQDKGCGTKL